ncbi:hypothetical protein PHLGIDRAFT_19272 [Phlebiopsis gigantea 11061_1 CR5-6]|uniref:MYND-type domain-containing protein n=1 Tax=Phlebiopsis gigantea (strain 11061_1 CR5-6) TaxID=745531 RepID=A0A0C3S812_PHLG1|nr:hypothetical protein PHLGIDRAFT_19272 [Phlebiopsis gigantea 11061_1 CR5-6]
MFRGADSMVFLFSALLQERPRLVIFERHIHSFFSILAPRMVSTLVGHTDPSEIKRLPEALEICYQLLRNCLANQEPRHRPDDIYIIREHSSITWRAFSSKINQALRAIDQSTENRAIFQHWAEIGKLLDSVEPEGQVAYCFPPVKRCGWELCPCSVHHPAHCLRVCKGCWAVAYCNASCQQSAWKEGGHRNICPGNRGRGSEISAAI